MSRFLDTNTVATTLQTKPVARRLQSKRSRVDALLSNEGLLTLDFLFALVLVLGLTTILLAVSYTLSIAEVVQYVAYSSSRAYFAANVTEDAQKSRAQAKFDSLLGAPGIKNLVQPRWITLNHEPSSEESIIRIDNFTTEYEGVRNEFVGVQIPFTAKALELRIPFFGSTASEDGKGFQATINSYLGREPSEFECKEFVNERWQRIQQLRVERGAGYSEFFKGEDATKYAPIADNGC
ncbi:MAG: hypothetical protein COT74_05440 [Bdellovibrionales bacterium CG10_big_fil_rev_8_21_14_0_10_45_34]|nr:MAG: hypothetical protein COT74_05440 [Bdellovibrionales bacterium CG10_big_fil_rev_8_21_14_0_10_45_34]